jgi:hypothetical protein
MTYKVWLSVEQIDEENNRYEDVGLPDSLGEFQNLELADAFCRNLLRRYNPQMLEGSDRSNDEFRKMYQAGDDAPQCKTCGHVCDSPCSWCGGPENGEHPGMQPGDTLCGVCGNIEAARWETEPWKISVSGSTTRPTSTAASSS